MAQVQNLHAQSSYGTIYGTAKAGDLVQVTSDNTGRSQQITVGSSGQFTINGLGIGHYKVVLIEGGNNVQTSQATVVAGSSTAVNFNISSTAAASAKSMGAVVVTAPSANAIDVKSTTVRTVFTADQLKSLPIPRSVLSVAMLTPGTVQNSAFGVPSFGGSSSAENAYYIDGFNVTDMYNSMSFNQVPWFAIAQEDVQTGSYGPEYGFSTGGVVSVNTKQGTNTWKGGVDVQINPYAFEGHDPTVRYPNGNIMKSYQNNSTDQKTYSAWIGGPLIKDKLFFFGAAQWQGTNTNAANSVLPTGGYDGAINAGATRSHSSKPYFMGRLDWNITDNNTATWTAISDQTDSASRVYQMGYSDNTPRYGAYEGTENYKSGGMVNILKDVWQVTDGLTVTGIYGQSKMYNPNEGNPNSVFNAATGETETYSGNLNSYASGCPGVSDYRPGYLAGTEKQIQGCGIAGNLSTQNAVDNRKTGTLNIEYVVGNHDIVLGGSRDSFSAKGGSAYEGGQYYEYLSDSQVEGLTYQTSASVGIHSTSWYLKDAWTIGDNWLLNYGIRNDRFTDRDGSGDNFIQMHNIWQPRLGLSWDVFGDSSLKVYATAGRYALPVDAGVALRAGSPSIYSYTVYNYSGYNSTTGVPTITGIASPTTYMNGESGSAIAKGSYSDQTLKPYTQDEFSLGFQKSFDNGWIIGLQLMRREMRTAIDDFCDWRPFAAWGKAHGYGAAMAAAGTDEGAPNDQGGCFLFNPGSGGTWNVDLTGNGQLTKVHLTGAEIGEPKARRAYNSATFTFEKQWDGKFYVKGSYVWSQSYGNMEGMVASSVGQNGAQADAGTTQAFDYPEIMQGSAGYLANDHRHVLNVFGAWKFAPEWELGLTVNIASGSPISCFGYDPDSGVMSYEGYGASYHYCYGKLSPAGSAGRTPWTYNISPNLSYMPSRVKGLTLRLTGMNLFNNVQPLTVYENAETGGSTTKTANNPYYKLGQTFEDPRSFMVEAEYDFTL